MSSLQTCQNKHCTTVERFPRGSFFLCKVRVGSCWQRVRRAARQSSGRSCGYHGIPGPLFKETHTPTHPVILGGSLGTQA